MSARAKSTTMARLMKDSFVLIFIVASILLPLSTQAGIIKDIYQKITNTNNRTDNVVKQSAPICGNGVFSTPDEGSLSPELIFITSKPVREERDNNGYGQRDQVSEIANEFRFHAENVTIEELRRHGFNPNAPVSFLMHGFTSGYPLQAWMSAIVESYTIDRETKSDEYGRGSRNPEPSRNNYKHQASYDAFRDTTTVSPYQRNPSYGNENSRLPQNPANGYNNGYSNRPDRIEKQPGYQRNEVSHNLFIVNWNYAARGILYPRAVANIPIVASYVTRFINDRLIDEARVDPRKIQLIGHSLGAHLAGYVGKNTKARLGRIYGLDPAGPCFGAISGPLYPSSKRLAPGDANEVISIHTNSALLGISEPLGRYSVFVEGGEVQPGCKGGGPLKSIGTLTWDGGDFDTVACSHSRAPNLLTYRHDLSGSEGCQMVAYECKDWNAFLAGRCGVCRDTSSNDQPGRGQYGTNVASPFAPFECIRIGLDWQYPGEKEPLNANQRNPVDQYGTSPRETYKNARSTSRPTYNNNRDNYNYNHKRAANETTSSSQASVENVAPEVQERRLGGETVKPVSLFLKTGDSQPYCVFHYQVILELNEPFQGRKKPPMSIVLQDSETEGGRSRNNEQNSLSNDEFGNQFDERTFTHLLTSVRKLKRIDHGTLLFREGLADGHRILKALHINYMSHPDPRLRQQLSSRLCPIRTQNDEAARNPGTIGEKASRFYFKPCDDRQTSDYSQTSVPNKPLVGGSVSSYDQSPRPNYNQSGYNSSNNNFRNSSRENYNTNQQNGYNNNNNGYNRDSYQRNDRN